MKTMSLDTPSQADNHSPENNEESETPIKSPCISVCALDGEGMCTGCFRTGDEIREWGNASNDERRSVLELCHEREKKVNPFL